MSKRVSTVIFGIVVSVLFVCVHGQGLIPGVPSSCYSPPETGPCRAFIPSFYFNTQTGACDCFVYGGCRGNSNRFDTLAACSSTCSVPPQRQSNTPSCDRIFREGNPLSGFLQSSQQVRQPAPQASSQIQNQVPAQIQSQPSMQAAASQPQRITVQQLKPVVLQQDSVRENEIAGSSGTSGSKTISSVVHGISGTRPGTITIGQPVAIIILKPQSVQSRTGSRAPESDVPIEAPVEESQSEIENQGEPEEQFDFVNGRLFGNEELEE